MKRLVSLAVSAALIAGTVFSLNTVALAEEVQHNDKSEEVQNFSKSNSYSDYVKDYKFADAEDIVLFDGSVLCKKETSFENTVSIPSDAWYNIEITYKSTENDTGEINFALLIDGEHPFEEAGQYTLPRLYQDDGEVRSDGLGNEFTPMQKEVYLQQTILLSNFSTFTTEASKFFFSKGEHTLTFEDFTCDAEIISIRLVSVEEMLDYETVLASYPKAENYDGEELLFEGEDAVYKSSSDLVAKSDSTTPAVYPTDPFIQKVNYIGSNWSDTGEEITWKINVEKSGLYKLSFHFRQNYILNGNSYRSIKIDGKIPFEEAGMVAFPYGNGWQTMTVSDNEGEPYLFYLEEGTHTFSMCVTLGPLSSFCTELEDIVYEIGAWYRKIVMITGETPDSNRDYNLFSQIGGLEDGLQSIVEDIEELVNYYEQLTGVSGGSTVSVLNSMKNSINSMLKYKYKAQQYKSSYYSNYSSVSATLYELMDMPLDIDTVVLSSPEKEVEKGNVSVFSKMSYSFKRFMASFAVDYNNISGDTQTDQEIVLWINWGRDQAQTLNALIQSEFISKTNIGVKVKITNASLVQGILSGNAPDVVLQHGRSEPVNLAMRGAAYDLSTFEDFDEVITRFADGATVPYEYKDGTYALPDTQSFMMMFIRTDIFEEMGLSIPTTWDEFISVMKILSGNNLETGIATGFNMFLAQHGGNLYNEELNATDLLSTSAISAFEFYTDFFTKYGCPKSYNFYNRFRTGLMPMGIQDYGMYATLKATAPEINDRWTMVSVPGLLEEDGTVNNLCTGGGTACMMLADTENPDAAWEFLKWWTDTETQVSYIQSLESVLGIAGRVATSNIEAASKLTWDGDCFENLEKQWQNVKEFNEIPGSYYITRVIDQAYWNVVENNENPKDMLYRWSVVADNEITRKIKQYEK